VRFGWAASAKGAELLTALGHGKTFGSGEQIAEQPRSDVHSRIAEAGVWRQKILGLASRWCGQDAKLL